MLVHDNSMSIACCLGPGADEKVPDHFTLTLLKNRLLEQEGKEAYNEVIGVALEKGLTSGQIGVVDGVCVMADVNL